MALIPSCSDELRYLIPSLGPSSNENTNSMDLRRSVLDCFTPVAEFETGIHASMLPAIVMLSARKIKTPGDSPLMTVMGRQTASFQIMPDFSIITASSPLHLARNT